MYIYIYNYVYIYIYIYIYIYMYISMYFLARVYAHTLGARFVCVACRRVCYQFFLLAYPLEAISNAK